MIIIFIHCYGKMNKEYFICIEIYWGIRCESMSKEYFCNLLRYKVGKLEVFFSIDLFYRFKQWIWFFSKFNRLIVKVDL